MDLRAAHAILTEVAPHDLSVPAREALEAILSDHELLWRVADAARDVSNWLAQAGEECEASATLDAALDAAGR